MFPIRLLVPVLACLGSPLNIGSAAVFAPVRHVAPARVASDSTIAPLAGAGLDSAWRAVKRLQDAGRKDNEWLAYQFGDTELTKNLILWDQFRVRALRDAALAVSARSSKNDSRWCGLLLELNSPKYVPQANQQVENQFYTRSDSLRWSAWRQAFPSIQQRCLQSNAIAAERSVVLARDIIDSVMALRKRAQDNASQTAAEWKAMETRVYAMGTTFPAENNVQIRTAAELLLSGYQRYRPGTETAYMHGLRDNPNALLHSVGVAALAVAQARSKPIDLSFKTTDGKTVSLAALRGKVVLVDFGYMSCPACEEDIPYLKAAYKTYRKQGFEIIGIDLEESDEERDVRAEFDRYMTKNGITWPMHFDPHGEKSPYVERFQIHAFPTVFMFGRDGLLIGMDKEVRGPLLEPAIRSALGLPPAKQAMELEQPDRSGPTILIGGPGGYRRQ